MGDSPLKTCKSCGEPKSLDNFYKKKSGSYSSPCKACLGERSRKWAKENPEKRKQVVAKSAIKQREVRWKSVDKYNNENPSWYLWNSAKGRSAKYGIPFTIEVSDVVVPQECPVFKVPMKRHTKYAPSLDRIDPEYGYIKGNVQVISRLANTMKSNATKEELKYFAKWLENTLSEHG